MPPHHRQPFRPGVRPPGAAPALGLLLALVACGDGPPRDPPPPFHFEDGTESAGIDFRHASGSRAKHYLVETLGAGVAVEDFDGDGHLDVYFVNGGTLDAAPGGPLRNALYFGDGRGRFRKAAASDPAADPGFGFGAVAADYDRDGDLDLYVCNWGPNRLFRNRGDGTFEDVTEAAGVGDPRWSVAAAFGDLDGDGWLDLYIANYLEFGSPASRAKLECEWAGIKVLCGPKGLAPEHDRVYRNRGDGTFEDVSEAWGILAEEPRYALAVLMADIDDDGDLDVYVANDSMANSCWCNDGKGRLVDMGLMTGTALSGEGHAQAGMGIAAEDFRGVGQVDLVVTNFARDNYAYYRRLPDGTYEDASQIVGIARATYASLGFGVVAEDFDRDGLLDLFFANGHVYPNVDEHPVGTTYAQRNQVFKGLPGGAFEDRTAQAGPGLERRAVSRGAASGDFDEDGRIDVVVSDLDERPTLLWNRTEPRGRWLAVRLRGTAGSSDLTCVGAKVEVRAPGRTWRREVRAGGSYASGSAMTLHFGLGDVRAVDEVRVRFPDGTTATVAAPALDRTLVIDRPVP